MNGRVHIHAPSPVREIALVDFHCKARCRDGRQCGGRWLYGQFWEWYGWGLVCVACGQCYGEGGGAGRHRDPSKYRARFLRVADERGTESMEAEQ